MKKETQFFLGVAALLTLTVFVSQISAQEETSQNLVERNHSTQQNERLMKAEEAYGEGLLTERQIEILRVRDEFRGMGQGRGGERGKMIELLNEKGLDVTHEEMQEINTLMSELGIRGNMGKGRHADNF